MCLVRPATKQKILPVEGYEFGPSTLRFFGLNPCVGPVQTSILKSLTFHFAVIT